MKTSLLWCLVVFAVICELGYEVVAGRSKNPNRRDRNGRGEHGGRRGRNHHHMCSGVMRRSRIDQDDINCSMYEDVINSDIADLYAGKQDEVFQSWIDMINGMTNREMEADDDDDEDDDVDPGNTEDELMIMCKRKFCFKEKMKVHLANNTEIPDFCKGRSADEWRQLREADHPQPGEHRPPMTVEKYTVIFCSRLTPNGRGKHGPGGRRGRGRGRGGRGKDERRHRPKDRRRKTPSDAQEVPV